MKYYVSRQCYWGMDSEDANTVEIAHGGLDYANPDMLCSKYAGEGETYADPVKAVEAAIEIAAAWKSDCPSLTINIAHGFTGGNTMPFEASTTEDLLTWAKEAREKLKKCDQCGELIENDPWHLTDYPEDGEFCSENCADNHLADIMKETEEEVA